MLRPTDVLFSSYIREKAGWRCERCGRVCKVNGIEICKLEASHYYGRRKESVRFDPDNVHALCYICHERMGGYKRDENGEYDLWMKNILGIVRYKALKIRANQIGKRDDYGTKIYILKLFDILRNNVTRTG